MNRNNFLIHLALAIVLVLIAAFAGQLNKWRNDWKSHVPRVVPAADKKRATTAEDMALAESRGGRPELLVKFKPGVSQERIEELVDSFSDRVEDRIESDPGLEAIDDLDNADAAETVAQYSALPEVEYAEQNLTIKLDAI
ncbi:MAG TPA: hypothetical protein VN844_15800, partial [Pyrinomonadaceae bacterium]|nr:hypothetical protein [Pyrinomonadaceae bacterium]